MRISRTTNLVVRIADPSVEIPELRALADGLATAAGLQQVKTVASTLFPAAWARRYPEPSVLSSHYRTLYPRIQRATRKNRDGTYFGRITAYPRADNEAPFDQLTNTVTKLRQTRGGRSLSSQYEISIWRPGDLPQGMGFPCLAHLSLHREDGRLHLTAYYRNQYLIERAYGNYLGLAGLQRYIATATKLALGELVVIAGHAEIDNHSGVGLRAVDRVLAQSQPFLPDADA
jgi:thymidylate synthase